MEPSNQTRSPFAALLALFTLLCGMLGGCSTENVGATQLLVVVNSDLQIGAQITAVEVEIQSADGKSESPDTRRFELSEVAGNDRFKLPLSFGVVRGDGAADNMRVVVRGYGPGTAGADVVVVEQKSIVTFLRQQSQRLTVFLGGSCFRVLCGDTEQTCYPDGGGAIGVCTTIAEAQLEKVKPGDELKGIVFMDTPDGGGDGDGDGDGDGPNDAGPKPQGALSVTLSGDGVGTVTSSAAGIDCGTACSASFDLASLVTLTATAGQDSMFSGWSGGICSGTEPCMVTVAQLNAVTATFLKAGYLLHVNMTGNGVGVVSSELAEISCGTDCDETFPRGAMVKLTASSTMGSSFLGWNGGNCEGQAETCTVTMDAAKNVSASFTCVATPGSTSFNFTGAPQTLTNRPLCVRSITVEVYGASGGNGLAAGVPAGAGGYGSYVRAKLTVSPSDVITVFVGGNGGSSSGTIGTTPGGYNGGGTGNSTSSNNGGGGGGGASDIRINMTTNPSATEAERLASRVVVAGGGGGGNQCAYITQGTQGGAAGGYDGGNNGFGPAVSCYSGTAGLIMPTGGTQTAGGTKGSWPSPSYMKAEDGSLGQGGRAGITSIGGGGGGGYYGGGGGDWEAGGGGSSYVHPSATEVTYQGYGTTSVGSTQYYGGYAYIYW
jgi:hypothetical protein